jgi:hypothetical protein
LATRAALQELGTGPTASRKRVAERVIERELRALESAVRTTIWRVVFDPAEAGKKSDGG